MMSESGQAKADLTNPLKPSEAEGSARGNHARTPSPATRPARRGAVVFILGVAMLLAAGAIAGLSIQNRGLRAEVQTLRAELKREQALPIFKVPPGDQVTQPKDFKTAGLKIISAAYGSGDKFSDVTPRVTEVLFRESQFYARPEWLKVDPTPGWNKALVITYEFNHVRCIFSCGEGGRVNADALLAKARKDCEPLSEWE